MWPFPALAPFKVPAQEVFWGGGRGPWSFLLHHWPWCVQRLFPAGGVGAWGSKRSVHVCAWHAMSLMTWGSISSCHACHPFQGIRNLVEVVVVVQSMQRHMYIFVWTELPLKTIAKREDICPKSSFPPPLIHSKCKKCLKRYRSVLNEKQGVGHANPQIWKTAPPRGYLRFTAYHSWTNMTL